MGEPAPSSTYQEPAPWAEEPTASLPAFPRESDLVEFAVEAPDSGLRYALDTRSLSLGSDRVVRYTVVVTSGSGARNVLYEGIRCDTKEYKTYAYGRGATLVPVRQPKWMEIKYARDAAQFRNELVRTYLCDGLKNPLSVAVIERRLRYPPER